MSFVISGSRAALGWYSAKYDSIQPTTTFVMDLDLEEKLESYTTIKF